jgi:hypothetical protein
MRLMKRLLRVLGERVFWSFALVTFLMAALLSSVNLTSRFALKDYVDGQLQRTPWDLAVFQQGGADAQDSTIADRIRVIDGVKQVETLAILRAKLSPKISATMVDDKPLATPWLTLVAATDPSLLPPQVRPFLKNSQGGQQTRPILGLIGPESSLGDAFRALQGATELTVEVKTEAGQRPVFQTPLGGVVRLERDELSRWLMDQVGAPLYVPPVGVVLLMPYDEKTEAVALKDFDRLARGIVPADMQSSDSAISQGRDAGHEESAEYIPEVNYMVRIDRDALISGWDVEDSESHVAYLTNQILRALAPKEDEPPASARRATDNRFMARVNADVAEQPSMRNAVYTVGDAPPFRYARLDDVAPQVLLAHNEKGHEDEMTMEGDAPVGVSGYIVDSTSLVLLQQMQEMARLIGIVTLLIALPLLWMGWMLASNLAGLLMLNERRKLGLMRLRGVPGRLLGRSLLIAISSGGLLGGICGIVLGSVVLLLIYEHGSLPLSVLLQPQQLLMFGLFLLITVVLSLLVSARLIKYATTISPLEASGRFASSEAAVTNVKFGLLQAVALLLGAVALAGWVYGFSPGEWIPFERLRSVAVILDFLALPLFLYGIITLLGSRRSWIQALMAPFQKLIGGRLGLMTQRHMAAKPHRSVAFLMIVALMASISLYPTVASVSFEDKAERGAQVQIGSDWHFTFNSPDLADPQLLRGALDKQVAALDPQMQRMVAAARELSGVESVGYMIEASLPSFYIPGAGLRGVPLYLLHDTAAHKNSSYAEPELGLDAPYREVLQRVQDGGVAVSPAVAEFWEPVPGKALRLGMGSDGNTVAAPAAGILGQLPGMPPRSVTSREGYVQSRVDYLNYIFERAAYIVGATDNPQLQDLQVFIPRTVLMVKVDDGILENAAASQKLQADLLRTFTATPLEIHTLPEEIRKVGSSMFISLAVENMKIYLVGGIVLALIAILAIALANYAEDRRTLALLRIRGTSPKQLRRFLTAAMVSPAILGLVLGGATALIAGFGLTNHVWELRSVHSVVELLRTHLVVSELTVAIAALLLGLVVLAAWLISVRTFRSSARELH